MLPLKALLFLLTGSAAHAAHAAPGVVVAPPPAPEIPAAPPARLARRAPSFDNPGRISGSDWYVDITARIGRGHTSNVFKGNRYVWVPESGQWAFQAVVAAKLVRLSKSKSKSRGKVDGFYVKRCEREVDTQTAVLGASRRSAVPEIFVHGINDRDGPGWYQIIQEFIEGQTLKSAWGARDFDFDMRKTVALNLAMHLRDMQSARVAHFDLKPDNIMVNPATGSTTLIDFGGAAFLSPFKGSYMKVSPDWNPRYASPEVVNAGRGGQYDEVPISFQSTVYSFYAVLFEMLWKTACFLDFRDFKLWNDNRSSFAARADLMRTLLKAAGSKGRRASTDTLEMFARGLHPDMSMRPTMSSTIAWLQKLEKGDTR